MAISHRGAISFGLVHIPIGLYTATQDNDIHFKQLCQDMSRVRYKKVCASCGKEIKNNDILKGFEYEKDKYVIVTEDDFEKIKTEKDRTVQIIHFTDLSSVRPIYFEKSYHVIPEKGGEKAFELLRRAMEEEGKVAIGKTVMGNKETLLCILPTAEGLLIETLFFDDEIREPPRELTRPTVKEDELSMAKTLIGAMDQPFAPQQYQDEYQERLKEMIAAKIAGQEVAAAAPEETANVIDLMEALKASLEQKTRKGA